MTENFDKAMEFIFFWEKEISHESGDPGGYSVWGITSRDFPDIVKTLKNLTYAESQKLAKKFYYQNFWQKIKGDDLLTPIDIVLMDCAVNQGVGLVKRIQQDNTDWQDMIIARLNRYDDLSSKFLRGWCKRLVSLHRFIKSNFKDLSY